MERTTVLTASDSETHEQEVSATGQPETKKPSPFTKENTVSASTVEIANRFIISNLLEITLERLCGYITIFTLQLANFKFGKVEMA
jgi:hypothetical protein